jgi:single-stranded-DNA-specific exonuclease
MLVLTNKSATNKVWVKHKVDNNIITQIANFYQIPEVMAKLLYIRGVDIKEVSAFLNPKIKDLMIDPHHIVDMEKACNVIISSILNNEKITILGDYDVDGITSTTVLYKYLKSLGANVFYYIPDRYKEGYGVSMAALENIKANKPDLLILLDNGSVAYQEVLHANEVGIKVIIVDHHAVELSPPKACAIVNPNRFDDNSKLNHLCTVGLVFFLVVALNRLLSGNEYLKDKIPCDIMSFLDLIALGTLCDMVPLKGINRAFVTQGLKLMQKKQNMPLRILSENLGIDKPIDMETLGFTFGPIINAGSRMGKSTLPLELLLAQSESTALAISEELLQNNKQRQKEEDKMIQHALQTLSEIDEHYNKNFVFVGSENWLSGIVGIIAGRLKENYNKPACAFAIDKEKNIATGSGRSVPNIDLGAIILGAKQKGLLIKGGGHSQAVGFSFAMEKKDELFEYINKQIHLISKSDHLEEQKQMQILVDEVIPINAINIDFIEKIQSLAPFGINFPEPIFMLSNVKLSQVEIIGEHKNHISCLVGDGFKYYIKGFCFKSVPSTLGQSIVEKNNQFCSLLVNVKKNIYKGKTYSNLIIKDIF